MVDWDMTTRIAHNDNQGWTLGDGLMYIEQHIESAKRSLRGVRAGEDPVDFVRWRVTTGVVQELRRLRQHALRSTCSPVHIAGHRQRVAEQAARTRQTISRSPFAPFSMTATRP